MIDGYLQLLRFKEWLPAFVFVIIGYILTRSLALNDTYLILLVFASFLLIGSSVHIINDYFDKEFDKKKKDNRNPISIGLVNEKLAIILALLFAVSGLGLSYFLLQKVFLLSLCLFIVLFLSSAPPFRLKEKFALDVIMFCFIMPLHFLIGYMLFQEISFPITMLAIELFIFGMTMELLQEIRDYNADKECGFKTTVIMLGIGNSIKLVRLVTLSFIISFSLTIYMYFPLYFLLLLLSLLPMVKFVFSRNIGPDVMIPDVGIKGLLVLLPIFLVILPLWYGFI